MQDRLLALAEVRKQIMEEAAGSAAGGETPASKNRATVAGSDGSDMVEIELKRLEVMQRRHKLQLAQMVSFELERKRMQVISGCDYISALSDPFIYCLAPNELAPSSI